MLRSTTNDPFFFPGEQANGRLCAKPCPFQIVHTGFWARKLLLRLQNHAGQSSVRYCIIFTTYFTHFMPQYLAEV